MVGWYFVGYSAAAWLTFWTAVGAHSMRMWCAGSRVDAAEASQDHASRTRSAEDLLAEVFPEGVTL